MIPTPPTLAGLFFCLASAEGAGLLFYPAAMQSHASVYRAFCRVVASYHPRHKIAYRALHGHSRLFATFSRYYYICVHPAILHHLRHAGAYHSAVAPPVYNRYQRHARRCTDQHRPPIIIMYIRVKHIADHARPAGLLLPSADLWQVLHLAHLLRGQRLHLYRVSPAGSIFFTLG